MARSKFLSAIADYKNIILLMLIGAVLFFAISMVLLKKYESSAELLVIQKQSNWKIDDAYSAAKSAEQVSSMLVHAIGTTTFLDRVMSSGYALDESILDLSIEDRKEGWNRMVKAKAMRNSGIIKLSVFHSDKEISGQLVSAVAYVLREKSSQYHGGGDRIEVKVIDGPITSENPASPYLEVNTLLGAIIGLFAGIALDRKKNVAEKKDQFNFALGGNHGFVSPCFESRFEKSEIPSVRPPENLPS